MADRLYFGDGWETEPVVATASSGVLAITGASASGVRAYVSSASVGAVVVTGNASQAAPAFVSSATPAELAITGTTTAVIRTYRSHAPPAEVSLAGSLATGTYSGAVIVTLLTPLDTSADVAELITFTWQAFTDAVDYQIQIATENTFAFPVIDALTTGEVTYTTSDLDGGETYYWRVRAEVING